MGTTDTTTVRDIILARIARRNMARVTTAQVWNWGEIPDAIGAVAVERAIRSLIADGTVTEDMHYGALAFTTR